MNILRKELTITTKPLKIHNITREINSLLQEANIQIGIVHIFLKHTSCSLTINENADPDVLKDLHSFSEKLAPRDEDYIHRDEGPDDMPAHIKSSVFGAHLTAPIHRSQLEIGTWQGIYLWEHRDIGRARHLTLMIMGK